MISQEHAALMLETLQRIAASDPKHSQFIPLVLSEVREVIEVVTAEEEG